MNIANIYHTDKNQLDSIFKNFKIKIPISTYNPKINISSINPDSE